MRRAEKQSAQFVDIFWDAKNLATIQAASVDLKDSPVAQVFRAGYQELQRLTKAKRGTTAGERRRDRVRRRRERPARHDSGRASRR